MKSYSATANLKQNKISVAKDCGSYSITLYLPVTKIAEFANSVDLDEVAHNEPPHLDLHCLPSSL